MINFQNLENISIEAISDTMNLAFSDYSIPISFPVESLQQKFITENIQPNLSIGAFNNNNLIGVILHGYNSETNTIYNGGTGVIPSFRGQKLTQKMYEFASTIFENFGIKKQQLEVISGNVPAIKSYKKVGFSIVRKLNCFKGNFSISTINSSIEIKELNKIDWATFKAFWDIKPTWQNDIQAMKKSIQIIQLLGAFLNNKLVGYLILNPKTKRVHQFAVSKKHRNLKIGSTLFGYVQTNFSDSVTVINVDDNDITTSLFLEKIGLTNFLQQFEMCLDTKSK